MDGPLHGYYIHGESPLGVSEVSKEHLRSLCEGEPGKPIRYQGLTPADSDLQTYEMFVSKEFRQKYDAVRVISTMTHVVVI